ncbi:MAG: hypothetical protein N3J91_14145 [Verrucomicrobiae bacterium]|nr:hypothetical protein [Verrucomicrobiae bacterium]
MHQQTFDFRQRRQTGYRPPLRAPSPLPVLPPLNPVSEAFERARQARQAPAVSVTAPVAPARAPQKCTRVAPQAKIKPAQAAVPVESKAREIKGPIVHLNPYAVHQPGRCRMCGSRAIPGEDYCYACIGD